MKTSARKDGGTAFLFSMILFLVYILCAVFIILIGSRVYSNIRARNEDTFQTETALSYISNKVRQADSRDSISVEEKDGVSVLVLSARNGGTVYETWIYAADGSLKELFSEKDSGLTVQDGLDIMECGPVSFSVRDTQNGQLLCVSMENEQEEARIFFRSEQSASGEGGGQ